jgi:cobalamin synthase
MLAEQAAEIAAAFLFLTGSTRAAVEPARVARGGAVFPALGIVLAAPVVLLLSALDDLVPPAARAALGVLLLAALSRGTAPAALGAVVRAARVARHDRARALAVLDALRPGASGAVALIAVALLKGGALCVLDGTTLALAVLLAVVLGRWAIAVHVYGSLAARQDDLAAALVRGLQFNQFAVASVTAMAVTLAASNAMGVLLLFGVATVTIAFRIAVHGWLGGVAPATVRAAGEMAETVVLLLCAALVQLARALGA